MLLYFKENKWLKSMLIFFGFLFCAISLVNHYNFRTYGWDLGINNNAIFDYAHFRWNDCMIMQPSFTNVLSDHFSLYPIIFSPLYWILGSYTMLIVQITAILLGGIGVYAYIIHISNNKILANFAVLHFFSLWGIYSALGFDYHDNVVAAMLLPWFLLLFEKSNFKLAFLFFIFMLIAKENMALWAIFIGFGLFVKFVVKKQKKQALFGLFMSLFAAVYFICVVKIIIPWLATPGRDYLHYSYHVLGNNFEQALVTMIKHPLHVFKLLFVNHTQDLYAEWAKTELYIAIFFGGGLTLIFFPEFFIMAIPIVAQKVFNDLPVRWGLNDHYSIELAPILSLSTFTFLYQVKKHQFKWVLCFVFFCLASNIYFLAHRKSPGYKADNTRFYKKEHWIRKFDIQAVRNTINSIPKNVKVSAQSALCPHLAFREYIYHYPHVADAEYIALLTADENKYPFDENSYRNNIIDLIQTGKWEIFRLNAAVLILKRKN